MTRETLSGAEEDKAERDVRPRPAVALSVVVPVCERYDDLRQLCLAYAQELSGAGYSHEFIFVVDGSGHDALGTLQALKKEHPDIQVIKLHRWFGEATALSVGLSRTRGPMILTLPAYFQVEPPEVRKLINKLVESNKDVVIAWRHPRIDSTINQVQSRVFHWLARWLTGTNLHDVSCSLRVMKRKVAEEIRVYGDLHRFFPLLACEHGFQVEEVPVPQSRRDAKRRVHQPGVYLRRLLDLLTLFFLFKFTKKPLRFFGLIGSGLFGTGAIITAYLGLYRMLGLGAIAGRPLLILGVLMMVLGIQLFSIGLLGEIIVFTHARELKEYQIEEILE